MKKFWSSKGKNESQNPQDPLLKRLRIFSLQKHSPKDEGLVYSHQTASQPNVSGHDAVSPVNSHRTSSQHNVSGHDAVSPVQAAAVYASQVQTAPDEQPISFYYSVQHSTPVRPDVPCQQLSNEPSSGQPKSPSGQELDRRREATVQQSKAMGQNLVLERNRFRAELASLRREVTELRADCETKEKRAKQSETVRQNLVLERNRLQAELVSLRREVTELRADGETKDAMLEHQQQLLVEAEANEVPVASLDEPSVFMMLRKKRLDEENPKI